MRIRLKRLRDQTIVLTDATSGVGLAIARKAASRGATLVLAGQDARGLDALVEELRDAGAAAETVVADVAVESEVSRIADTAVNRFGGFDTWINNAAVSTYGPLLDIEIEDQRRLFDTNYWAVVYGSLAAVRHLRTHGGAIINVGSVLSDVAVPLQGAYAASKHAVKGFTDALRMEVESEGTPVSVTLIKPSSPDTAMTERSETDRTAEPQAASTAYSARLAADAVLHAAEHPIRDMVVGGGGKLLSLAGTLAPRLTDRLLETRMARLQHAGRATGDGASAGLYQVGSGGFPQRHYPVPTLRHRLYDEAAKRPLATATLAVGAGLLLWALVRRR